MVVHLPIGILCYVFLQFCYDNYFNKKSKSNNNLQFALVIIFLSALISTLTGYERYMHGGFEGDLVELHKYMGLALLICCILLLVFYKKHKQSKAFAFSLFCVLLVLGYTGHLGGSLTHGTGFLSIEKFENYEDNTLNEPLTADLFSQIILPIVNSKCGSCHNDNKSKGSLKLLSKEQWLNGGDSGKLFDFSKKSNSLLLKRLHLPIGNEEHMPPEGKKQLTVDEFKILEWWINSVKTLDEKVEDLAPSESILNAITNLYFTENNVIKYTIKDLKELEKHRIRYNQLDNKNIGLGIDMTSKTVEISDLKKLKIISDNIFSFDFSFAILSSAAIKYLTKFNNLKHIELDNSSVSSNDLKPLMEIKKLEILNLYNTTIDSTAIEIISNLKALRKVFLWQSNLTIENVEMLQNKCPSLEINFGTIDQFEDVQLSKPRILSINDIFKDSISVELKALPISSSIFYTIENDTTEAELKIYEEPFLISKSTTLWAKAVLKGWNDSEFIEKTFLKSSIKPINISLVNAPDDKYAGRGESTLFDLSKGSEIFSDGEWLGFTVNDCVVNIELDKAESLSSVAIGCLSDITSYIFPPRGIQIQGSKDGIDYFELAEKSYEEMPGPELKAMKNFLVPFEPSALKYLRIKILNQGYNPTWHPAPKAPSWLFIDEIALD